VNNKTNTRVLFFEKNVNFAKNYNFSNFKRPMRSPWQIAMASGWEYEGPGFEPLLFQVTFDPNLPKK